MSIVLRVHAADQAKRSGSPIVIAGRIGFISFSWVEYEIIFMGRSSRCETAARRRGKSVAGG